MPDDPRDQPHMPPTEEEDLAASMVDASDALLGGDEDVDEPAEEPVAAAPAAAPQEEPAADEGDEGEAPLGALEEFTGLVSPEKQTEEPTDDKLAQAHERTQQALLDHIATLQKREAKPAEPVAEEPEPKPLTNEEIVAEAKKIFEEAKAAGREIDTDDLLEAVGVMMNASRKSWTESELKPIKKRLKEEDARREEVKEKQSVVNSVVTGLRDFVADEDEGSMAHGLAREFAVAVQTRGLEDAFKTTWLGVGLAGRGWSLEKDGWPEVAKNPRLFEGQAIATAASMDRYREQLKAAQESENGAAEETVVTDPPTGVVPKKARRTKSRQTPEEREQEEFFAAVANETGDAASILLDDPNPQI